MTTLEKIQPLFRDIFDDEELTVTEETVAADVKGWDSFAQMHIIMGVEDMFGISLSTDDITGLKNVGDIVKAIEKYTV